jgi:hypothetical protein
MGLYVEIGWKMAVWEPKAKNSGWWRHLHLIRHFEVLKKKIFYDIFFILGKLGEDGRHSEDGRRAN